MFLSSSSIDGCNCAHAKQCRSLVSLSDVHSPKKPCSEQHSLCLYVLKSHHSLDENTSTGYRHRCYNGSIGFSLSLTSSEKIERSSGVLRRKREPHEENSPPLAPHPQRITGQSSLALYGSVPSIWSEKRFRLLLLSAICRHPLYHF